MIIRVCTFTEQGESLARKLFEDWEEMIPQWRSSELPLKQWAGECFAKHLPILFVGACGIAVRAIAPYVQDKLTDSAVLVMDEKGEFVIPILSGHVGGANALAKRIAERVGAEAVLTTATDVEGLFSVDAFAVEHGLRIVNREGIRRVSAKLLRGETICIAWEPGIPGEEEFAKTIAQYAGLLQVPFDEPQVDVRIITPETASEERASKEEECKEKTCEEKACEEAGKEETGKEKAGREETGKEEAGKEEAGKEEASKEEASKEEAGKEKTCNDEVCGAQGQALLLICKDWVLGMGCKRGKTFEELRAFLEENLPKNWEERVCAIASIDRKVNEEGLRELAQFYHLPFLTYSAEELERVEGEFSESEFVKEVTGVSNVCERAALCGMGTNGSLIRKKIAKNGMTLAVAKKEAMKKQ